MTTTEVSNSIRGIAADSLATVSSLGWNDCITVGEPITVTKDGYITLTKEEEKEKVPKETTNILFTEGNSIKVKNCKDGEVQNTKTIMSDIKDIEVKYNSENSTVIFATFKDGKTEKAVLDKDDEFSLEHGLTIIMLEKLLSDKGVDGKSVHNKLVSRALKLYNKLEKEKND
ncbi:MAG: hypothetical protein UH850_15060, partial [Paludibacteraceae bacterium]|nr:hypothetical protein [Paludibacteraceae bacterium]